MDKTNETNTHFDAQDDVINLGIASIETKGIPPVGDEGQGLTAGVGITE